jgi:plasmid maintenance system antidote protein VapI
VKTDAVRVERQALDLAVGDLRQRQLATSAEMWTGMQAQYDLWLASRQRRRKVPSLSGNTLVA